MPADRQEHAVGDFRAVRMWRIVRLPEPNHDGDHRRDAEGKRVLLTAEKSRQPVSGRQARSSASSSPGGRGKLDGKRCWSAGVLI